MSARELAVSETCGPSPIADTDLSRLLLIRHFERALLDLFARGQLNGTTHTCLGQEHVPVALAPLLAGDFVFSNHRGHGHYLALFDDPAGLLAEIMGREGAVCGGVGGSQHLRRDGFLSTGVQGESLPVAVGVAMHFKQTGQPRIAAAFIGDGTWGEGAVYEALNLAQLWRVPLLVVVEHNGIAQSTPTERQLAGSIQARAAAFGVAFHRMATVDVTAARTELAPLVHRVRDEHRPLVVQYDVPRLGPHSKGDDTRDEREMARLADNDWHRHYAAAFPDRVEELSAMQERRVRDVVADVSSRPLARWEGPCR